MFVTTPAAWRCCWRSTAPHALLAIGVRRKNPAFLAGLFHSTLVAVGGVLDEIMRAITAEQGPRIAVEDAPRLFPSEHSLVIKKFVMRSPGGLN